MFASTAVLNGTVTELEGDMVKVLSIIEFFCALGLITPLRFTLACPQMTPNP